MKYLKGLFIVFLIFLTGCDGAEEIHRRKLSDSNFFLITNDSPEPRTFELIINGRKFYQSIEHIMKVAFDMQKIADTTWYVDSLKAIWLSTNYKSVHNTPLTGLDWFHHPILFYNSAGLGLCDDVANVNEAIWAWMGFPARTWYMEAHVVSEAYQRKWKMYDSDLGVYYQHADSVLSFKDLEGNPAFLLQKENRKEILQRTAGLDDNFWKYVAGIYGTPEDNQIEDWPPAADSSVYDYSITLPPGAELIFGKALRKFPINLEFDAPNYFNLIFKCENIAYYKSKLFLIPISIKGSGIVRINSLEYRIEDITDSVLFDREQPIKTIELINASQVEITYMVNGYVFDIYGSHYDLRVRGNTLEGLNIQTP